MEALLRWAAEMGVSDSPSLASPSGATSSSSSSCLGRSLVVAEFPDAGGRGLAAAHDLRRGELMLRAPRAALLTSDRVTADNPRIGACVSAHRPRFSSVQILILCLLAEVGKGKDSVWYPYLSQLPRYYTILATFNDFEVEALQIDNAIWVAQKAIRAIILDWEEATPLMKELEFKPKLLILKSWLWAFATVSSRTLHIPWDDAGCLCPVGDLFNYAAPDDDTSLEEEDAAEVMNCQQKNKMSDSSKRLTDGGYEDANGYCFYARKKYRKGEQVLLGYGTYTNLELLEHYGFILDENPNEKTFIQLDLDICSVGTWPKDSMYIQPNGHPSFALLCALRLWTTAANRRKAISYQIYSGSLVSTENELEIMKWLISKCEETLQQLPTTVEFDESLLIFLRKIQNSTSWRTDVKQSCFEQEFAVFLRVHRVELDCSDLGPLPARLLRSLERWELAVRWRCNYKKTLTKCILYCASSVHELSLQRNQQ
ncbi:protein SET DOMAIN GROUP 40-like [Phragmites australis]|uniref:protein SET DOMAIN GROUP 40-like n=1 Tax=Phragmites australis TaxID=29695 RepID=UPI002D78564F|nr:protein SET DOMAIN GROUP 40-like [Phragmites australis]XP_062188110.1 protein SET DOMAIN GROUP 40-like [Phragmites australis]